MLESALQDIQFIPIKSTFSHNANVIRPITSEMRLQIFFKRHHVFARIEEVKLVIAKAKRNKRIGRIPSTFILF